MTASADSAASRVEKVGLAAALVLVAVGLLLRIPGTMEWWLNPDEGIYFSILTQPTFAGFWAEVAANAHPPLYYVILRGMGFFTVDYFWFRALSLLSGGAAIFAMWLCGREIAGADHLRRTVTGLVAATFLVVSPQAITLSQIMRPYMLQLALLAGALAMLLRYGRAPSRRGLMAYAAPLILALLIHYSSVLALGSFGVVALYLVRTRELSREARRDLVWVHGLAAIVVVGLYFLHLRHLVASDTANDALNGWLSFYLADSPRQAWLAFVGLQTTVAGRSLGGPATVLMVIAVVVALVHHQWLPVVVVGSALAVGLLGSLAGVYPMGATRHSTWLLAFTLPAMAWLVGLTFTSGRRWAAAGVVGLVLLGIGGGALGAAVGVDDSPWAAPERVLRQDDLMEVLDLLDPDGAPRLMVMDLQTYNLLLPFYYSQRQQAEGPPDGSFFHFRYGRRDVVVVGSWLLTAGAERAGAVENLRSLAKRTQLTSPQLALGTAREVAVLIGGWRSEVVDQLLALGDSGVVTGQRMVPGLFAFMVDMVELESLAASEGEEGTPDGPR